MLSVTGTVRTCSERTDTKLTEELLTVNGCMRPKMSLGGEQESNTHKFFPLAWPQRWYERKLACHFFTCQLQITPPSLTTHCRLMTPSIKQWNGKGEKGGGKKKGNKNELIGKIYSQLGRRFYLLHKHYSSVKFFSLHIGAQYQLLYSGGGRVKGLAEGPNRGSLAVLALEPQPYWLVTQSLNHAPQPPQIRGFMNWKFPIHLQVVSNFLSDPEA